MLELKLIHADKREPRRQNYIYMEHWPKYWQSVEGRHNYNLVCIIVWSNYDHCRNDLLFVFNLVHNYQYLINYDCHAIYCMYFTGYMDMVGAWVWCDLVRADCIHTLQGFCWPNFVTGHFYLKCTKGIKNSHQYIQKLSWSLEVFRTSRILIRLCPEIWMNKDPWSSELGWVGLWGFLWWAPSAKRKDHHGVSSGWSSVWHCSNTGLSSSQYEQISIILGVWPFCLTPIFFRSITFWRAYG